MTTTKRGWLQADYDRIKEGTDGNSAWNHGLPRFKGESVWNLFKKQFLAVPEDAYRFKFIRVEREKLCQTELRIDHRSWLNRFFCEDLLRNIHSFSDINVSFDWTLFYFIAQIRTFVKVREFKVLRSPRRMTIEGTVVEIDWITAEWIVKRVYWNLRPELSKVSRTWLPG